MFSKFETGFIDKEITTPQDGESPVLRMWVEANDFTTEVVPVNKEVWEEKKEEGEILEEEYNVLHIPESLSLLDMGELIGAIDKDTYRDNPELSEQGIDEIVKLGDTFEKAAKYISQYSAGLREGKDISEELSDKFSKYGLLLKQSVGEVEESNQSVALTEKDKQILDRWFLGEEIYSKIINRLGSNPSLEVIEQERVRYFRGYFKALAREGCKDNNYFRKESLGGVIANIHEKTEEGITKEIRKPDKILFETIWRRGMEQLKRNMLTPREYRESIQKDKLYLYNYLKIPQLRKQLKSVRKRGNIERISNKELEIAGKIYKVISKDHRYLKGVNSPSKIVNGDFLDCLGSALLGSALLDEIGIKYYFVTTDGHIMTFLRTTDQKLYYQDFTPKKWFSNWWLNHMIFELKNLRVENDKDILSKIEEQNFVKVYSDNYEKELFIWKSKDIAIDSLFYSVGNEWQKKQTDLHEDEKAKINVDFFKKLAEFNEYDPFIFLSLGNAHLSLRQYKDAEKFYKKAIELDPFSSRANTSLGAVYVGLNKYRDAIDAYRRAVELDRKDINAVLGLGEAYCIEGRYDEAEKVYKRGIKHNPENTLLSRDLGNLYCDLKRYDEAEKIYKEAIKHNPENASLLQSLGDLYRNLERYEEAEKAYKKGIEFNPKSALLYGFLGHLYCKLKRYDEAEETYKEGLKFNPEKGFLYICLGDMYCILKRYKEAEEVYKEGIKHDSKEGYLYYHLGGIYYTLRRYEEAEKILKEGIKNSSENTSLYRGLRDLYYKLYRYEEADEIKEKLKLLSKSK
ncbi:MAG: tetratricopeptide repeat protein [Candidatus Dojkabacteria bacterium]